MIGKKRKPWRFIWLALLPALILTAGPVAAGKSATSSGQLTLVYEARTGYAPWDCYHEDSYHVRWWAGDLAAGGQFEVVLPFCTFGQYPSGPGGAGFLFGVTGNGSFSLVAISPSGTVYPAHLVGQQRGTVELRRCIVPPYFDLALQVGVGTIEPGLWKVVLTNTGNRLARDLTVRVEVNQAVADWQKAVCPSQDWNFTR